MCCMLKVLARNLQLPGKEAMPGSVAVCMLSPRDPSAPDEKSPGPDSFQVGPPAAGMSCSWEVSSNADYWMHLGVEVKGCQK